MLKVSSSGATGTFPVFNSNRWLVATEQPAQQQSISVNEKGLLDSTELQGFLNLPFH